MVTLLVGRITKAHGLRGEVVVDLLSTEEARLAPGTSLESDHGPLTVTSSRPFQGKWLVLFEGVAGRDAAERLRGVELRGEPIEDPDALWLHDLLGATVVDAAGVGRKMMRAVLANPADDLLELDGGALVPVTCVTGWSDDGHLLIDPPVDLFDW